MPRLVTVRRDELSIHRHRRGKGFTFSDADGNTLRDPETRERIRALGIPPAWRDVRIAGHPRAHIQCVGTDEAGRLQYIYHADWEARRTKRKLGQLSLLTQALARLRRRVATDLKAEAGTKTLALALAVAMIDRTAMRVGRERYLASNGTRGAGTLFTRDVGVEGDNVRITFPAKSGKVAHYTLHDPALADAIRRIKTLPGKRLLVYRTEAGAIVPIKTEAINAYLREISNERVTAKDFRTLHASALAAEALVKLDPAASETARKRQITGVTKQVAEFLRNTPLICRQSYIAPCLFSLFDKGRLHQLWNTESPPTIGLRQREIRLATVLASVR